MVTYLRSSGDMVRQRYNRRFKRKLGTYDVTEDNHYGTCILADGNLERVTFKTYAYNTLYKGMERNKEQTYRLLCPTSKLKRLLATETSDEDTLRVCIAESYTTYANTNQAETITTRDVTLAVEDAAERSKDDDNTNTGYYNNPDLLINDGTYVCMVEDNHLPTFGVLVHDVTNENPYGTCIMADGNLDRVTFKTFAYDTLYKAMER